jgi:RNA polymerase sigma-70 factor (ECF subfamily)
MREGELADWNRIVEQHANHVFRVAMRILGCAQDAEDVSQDVFIEAFRLQQVDRVQSWPGLLVRLATLRALDHLRRKRPSEKLREGDRISTQGPFDDAAAKELATRMRIAIAELPDQQAAAFVLFHFEHLSRDEIGLSLGVTPEAVSTALYKARQRLLAQLATIQQGESR